MAKLVDGKWVGRPTKEQRARLELMGTMDITDAQPPINADGTVLDYTAPTLDKYEDQDVDEDIRRQKFIRDIDDGTVDITELEMRITLLSRLIIEKTLWAGVDGGKGLKAKDRAELAIKAVQLFEKEGKLWVRDDREDKLPATQEAYSKDMAAMDKRVRELLSKRENRSKIARGEAVVVEGVLDSE